MLSLIRKQLTATNVMVVAALVFAMSGGAYALTGGGKAGGKTVAQAAKKKSKSTRGARGPAGPAGKEGKQGPEGKAGATGPEGKAGATGLEGKEGKAGATGPEGKAVNGKSVTVTAAGSECKAGGYKFEVEGSGKSQVICNGEEAKAGSFPSTLPPGKTETGVWASENAEESANAGRTDSQESFEYRPISFAIPLPEPILKGDAFWVPVGAQKGATGKKTGTGAGSGELCEGKSATTAFTLAECEAQFKLVKEKCVGNAEEPLAAEGYLCVYAGLVESPEGAEYSVADITAPGFVVPNGEEHGVGGAGTSGALLDIYFSDPTEPALHEMHGSFAVTAE